MTYKEYHEFSYLFANSLDIFFFTFFRVRLFIIIENDEILRTENFEIRREGFKNDLVGEF